MAPAEAPVSGGAGTDTVCCAGSACCEGTVCCTCSVSLSPGCATGGGPSPCGSGPWPEDSPPPSSAASSVRFPRLLDPSSASLPLCHDTRAHVPSAVWVVGREPGPGQFDRGTAHLGWAASVLAPPPMLALTVARAIIAAASPPPAVAVAVAIAVAVAVVARAVPTVAVAAVAPMAPAAVPAAVPAAAAAPAVTVTAAVTAAAAAPVTAMALVSRVPVAIQSDRAVAAAPTKGAAARRDRAGPRHLTAIEETQHHVALAPCRRHGGVCSTPINLRAACARSALVSAWQVRAGEAKHAAVHKIDDARSRPCA